MVGKRRFQALGVGLLALVVAACGSAASSSSSSSNSSSSNGSNASSTSAAASAKSLFPHGVTLLVGFGTGGAVDTGARLIQPYLQKQLGVPVVVQNMVGGGGNTAAQYEYNQPATSSDLLMAFLPALDLGQVMGKGQYDVRKFTPIYGLYGNNTVVVIAKKGSKYKDLASLKSSSQKITAGVAGVGTSSTWMGIGFLDELNHANIQPVPYSGGSAASAAAVGGSVDITATTAIEAKRLISSGQAQGIVQFAPHAYSFLPGVPSIATVGKPSEAFESIMGIVGPPNMSKSAASVIANALSQAVKSSALQTKATNVGVSVVPQSLSEWTANMTKYYNLVQSNSTLLNAFRSQK